jgi:hypothetical protein
MSGDFVLIDTIHGCARCGGTHAQVTVKRFIAPVLSEGGGVLATHWAMCPESNEPIFVTVTETL